MRLATAALALHLCGCSLLFGDAQPAVSDAGLPDACVPVAVYEYPDVPLGARYIGGAFANDENDGLTPEQAWATFELSLSRLMPGDTLVVREGNYTEALKIEVSGTADSRITIMAEDDGLAVIDGEEEHVPCSVTNARFVDIVGLHCIQSVASAIVITGNLQSVQDVTLRSITALGGPNLAPTILVRDAQRLLFEDIAVSGAGDSQLRIMSSSNIEIRRFFAISASTQNQSYIFHSTGCENCLFQNLVIRSKQASNTNGILLTRDTDGASADGTRLLASLVYKVDIWSIVASSDLAHMKNNSVEHFVAPNGSYGLFQRSGENFLLDHLTFINLDLANVSINHNTTVDDKEVGFRLTTTLQNSVISGGDFGIDIGRPTFVEEVTSIYNDFHALLTERHTGLLLGGTPIPNSSTNVEVTPDFLTDKYGFGAYLMQPDSLKGLGKDGGNMGAELLYRYENGEPTSVPLWPWPMEDRIFRDLGVNVTFASSPDSDVGGIWSRLDGVYPTCD